MMPNSARAASAMCSSLQQMPDAVCERSSLTSGAVYV